MNFTESNYKTQSRDTNLKTEQFLIQAYRTMSAQLKANSNKIMNAESISLALKIAEILETLTIPYFVGGSIASSMIRRTPRYFRYRYCR